MVYPDYIVYPNYRIYPKLNDNSFFINKDPFGFYKNKNIILKNMIMNDLKIKK